jgi:hypothetical protein
MLKAIADKDSGAVDIGSERRSHSFRGVSDQLTPRGVEMLEVLHDVFESLEFPAATNSAE